MCRSTASGLALALVAASSLSCENPVGTSARGLSGTVTDVVSGGPLADVVVTVQDKTATTGNDGKYALSGLESGQATLTAARQGHVNFTQNVTIKDKGDTTTDVPMTPSAIARFAGTWSGSWRDTVTSNTGTVSLTASVNTVLQTFQLVLDVNGAAFSVDPAPETYTGTYSETATTTLTRTSPVFGTATISITPSGQITGSSTDIPRRGTGRFNFTGMVSPTSVALSYALDFQNADFGSGTVTLSK